MAKKGRIVRRNPPVGGWNTRDPVSAMAETDAIVMRNWIPSPDGIKQRPGYRIHITPTGSSAAANAVGTLMSWPGTATRDPQLLAAKGGDIYNVSTSGSSLGASVYGGGALSSAFWSSTIISTAALPPVLFMVNGLDSPVYFNGNTLAFTNPAITGMGTDVPRTVTNHKQRLWFTVGNAVSTGGTWTRGSMTAYYLPNNSVAGAATAFDLNLVARKGGYLVNTATWTRDGGLGPDDYLVFMTSLGEAIVYAGTDPSSATTWSLVGTYQLAPPVGVNCMIRAGGDLLVMTVRGVIPLSQAMSIAESGQANTAISDKIAPTWELRTTATNIVFNTTLPHWQILEWPRGKLLICNIPTAFTSFDTRSEQFVMHTQTMGWCQFDYALDAGVDTGGIICWALHKDDLFFGTGNKGVLRVTGSEDQTGSSTFSGITSTLVMSFQGHGSLNKKQVTMSRVSMLIGSDAASNTDTPVATMKLDYDPNATTIPTSTVINDALSTPILSSQWKITQGLGFALAPSVQWQSHYTSTLLGVDICFNEGGPVFDASTT